MRLKYQLFLTLLAASAVLITLMWLVNSWSFSRGFLEYQNNAAAARLQTLSVEIAERFDRERNWNWVTRRSLASPTQMGRRGDRARDDQNSKNNSRVGSDGEFEVGRLQQRGSNGLESKSHKPRKGSKFRPPLLLADSGRELLFGRVDKNDVLIWEPIQLEEKLIGYVGTKKLLRSSDIFEQAFERQQKRSFFYSALSMILISGLLAIPLASRIVRPLLSVNRAVGEISQGNYAHRVPIDRKDELGDLSQSINSLGLSLEKNRHARQRWIAEISHELRTPIAVLQAEVEAMQDGVRDINGKTIDSLHTEILQLSALVDDLHTLSMSDVGALDYVMQPLSLSDIIAEQIDSNFQLIHDAPITVSINNPTEHTPEDKLLVEADAKRIRQLIANLLQNSIRYTDTNGEQPARLEISLFRSRIHSNEVVGFEWSDSAPGVEDEGMKNLFEPLYRGEESRNRLFGGAGLGLAIAKRIVEAHQGAISAQSSPLGGLTIRVELPACERGAI